MKHYFYIALLCLLPFWGYTQEIVPLKDDTIKHKESKETYYKNTTSLEFELWFAAGFTYRRNISRRFSIGATFGCGFVAINPLGRSKNDLKHLGASPEGIKLGLLFGFQISKRWEYEFSPQCIRFTKSNFFDDPVANSFLSNDLKGYGIKNRLFFKIKSMEIGVSFFVGAANVKIEHDKNGNTLYGNHGIVRTNKLILYNSLLTIRFPLKKYKK